MPKNLYLISVIITHMYVITFVSQIPWKVAERLSANARVNHRLATVMEIHVLKQLVVVHCGSRSNISQRLKVRHLPLLMDFYAPGPKDRGHIVLPLSVCPSVRLSVCLHKLNMKTFPLLLN